MVDNSCNVNNYLLEVLHSVPVSRQPSQHSTTSKHTHSAPQTPKTTQKTIPKVTPVPNSRISTEHIEASQQQHSSHQQQQQSRRPVPRPRSTSPQNKMNSTEGTMSSTGESRSYLGYELI